jgi:hypothetical protein
LILVIFIIALPFNKSKANDIGVSFKNLVDNLFNKLFLSTYVNNDLFQEYIKNKFPRNRQRSEVEYVMYLDVKNRNSIFKIDYQKASLYLDNIWICYSIYSLFEKCKENNYDLNYSFIVNLNIENLNKSFSVSHLKNDKYSSLISLAYLETTLLENRNKIKLASNQIVLNKNNFLNNEIVFYFESEYNDLINKYISSNYDLINSALELKGMKFIYLPKLLEEKDNLQVDELLRFISYKFPELFAVNQIEKKSKANEIIAGINANTYYAILEKYLGIPYQNHPCLLHSIDVQTSITEDRKFIYSVFQLSVTDEISLKEKIENYITHVCIPRDQIYFSLKGRSKIYDADEYFLSDTEVSDEIKSMIQSIKNIDNSKLIVSSLIYIIKNLEDSQPDICEKLNKVLFKEINKKTPVLSRLFIDQQYRIFLPDYNSIEIHLTPLPKTLYLFLLRYPDGIKFKELSSHRRELIEIYCKVGNRSDMVQVKKSIEDLTDIRSNSVNEKCSRIKEAFLSKIDDSLACHYYVTGDRSDNKKITLDRSLLHFL